jgi:hypothetical protein
MTKLCEAIQKRNLDDNEEFLLNAVSCITNLLYYDTANMPLLTPEMRATIFSTLNSKQFLLATKNEEIQIETVRVMSNLSRHS